MNALPARLAEATTEEVASTFAANARVVALLPFGSTEAHGPHLPLATDVIIAENACIEAHAQLRDLGIAAFVLPPIPYAVTEFVGDFRGTLSVRASVVRELALEVGRAAFKNGFARLVLVNGHLEPEHARMVKDVATTLVAEGFDAVFPDQRRPPTVADLGAEFTRGGGHAGGTETSFVMAARPDLVREDARRHLPPLPIDIAEKLKEGAHTAREIGGDRAYFGEPAGATIGEGRRLFAVMATMIVAAALAPPAARKQP